MSSTSAPFGFIPIRHPSGNTRSMPYTILSTYATAIYKNQQCTLNTDGTIRAGVANTDILGIFAGVEYVDGSGKPTVSNYWPTGGVPGATNIRCYVWDDPDTEYLVQADGSIAQAAIGDQADVTNATANGNGMSQATLASSLAGAGVQAQFRITAIAPDIDNAVGDAYTKVYVKIARHQNVANKVAI